VLVEHRAKSRDIGADLFERVAEAARIERLVDVGEASAGESLFDRIGERHGAGTSELGTSPV
jgi:hypothetical protein